MTLVCVISAFVGLLLQDKPAISSENLEMGSLESQLTRKVEVETEEMACGNVTTRMSLDERR